MEKKDNVEKGVSEKPEEKKYAAYYEKRPEFGNPLLPNSGRFS